MLILYISMPIICVLIISESTALRQPSAPPFSLMLSTSPTLSPDLLNVSFLASTSYLPTSLLETQSDTVRHDDNHRNGNYSGSDNISAYIINNYTNMLITSDNIKQTRRTIPLHSKGGVNESSTSYRGIISPNKGSDCNSCKIREHVKADNLASIKRHILIRLEMRTLPNITSRVVPREIIEKFYKNHSLDNNDKQRYGSGSFIQAQDTTNATANFPSLHDDLQGDDPRIYSQNSNYEEEAFEEEFFSVTNSIYVFPSSTHARHRKADIHFFSLKNNGYSSVSAATLHIFIRGRDWMKEHQHVNLNDDSGYIALTVHRIYRHQSNPNSTHFQKVTDLRRAIPSGVGLWAKVDLTHTVASWFNNHNNNHGITIKPNEAWMSSFVVTDGSNKAYAPYIEVITKDNRKRRTKRSSSLNCLESDNEERCCRYPLEVNFREFDWDWIIAPTTFNAYYCNGECKLGFLPKYPHTHIMQMSTAPQPCCSPTKMSPIRLLYFNYEQQIVLSTIPNMAVDKCSCS